MLLLGSGILHGVWCGELVVISEGLPLVLALKKAILHLESYMGLPLSEMGALHGLIKGLASLWLEKSLKKTLISSGALTHLVQSDIHCQTLMKTF